MIESSPYKNDFSVCAIVVTYNPDLVIFSKLLNSLLSQVNYIAIVDNHSANISQIDQEVKMFNTLSGLDSHIIRNKDNEGLGKAQNEGIKFAKTKSATHVLILDQDSVLDSDSIPNMVETENMLLDSNCKVGSIGPTYRNDKTGETYPITRYIGPFIKRIRPQSEPVEASFLISSGCLIRMSVIDDVGFMDEGLFIDYVDVEWSYRARSFGYHLYVSPGATMNHIIGDNRASVFGRKISVHSPLRRYYLCRNSIHMIRNPNIPTGYKIREIVFNFLRISVFFFLSKNRFTYLKYSFRGFWDGLNRIKGPCAIGK